MNWITYIHNVVVSKCNNSPAEQADVEPIPNTSTDAESLPVKEQLSPMLAELGEVAQQSSEAFRYKYD